MINKKIFPVLKKVFLVISVLIFSIILFAGFQIWNYFQTKPIPDSQTYYRDPFGRIYTLDTRGCLDICIFPEFNKLPVDSGSFSLLLVKSPFTNIHRNGELIGSRYAKDRSQVYWYGKKISDADAPSFSAISYDLGHDKNGYYIGNQKLADYITDKFIQAEKFTSPPEVISYNPNHYLVYRTPNRYFYINFQNNEIRELTPMEASKYPSLNN